MTDASRMSFLQQHVCEICGKSYAQKNVLIRHLTVHNNEKLDCSICSKSFGNKFNLQKHEKIHNNRELVFECGQCGKKFLSKSSLTKHTQTKHNNFVFGCLYCSKSFPRKDCYDIHVEKYKDKNVGLNCDNCQKSFTNKRQLARNHQQDSLS